MSRSFLLFGFILYSVFLSSLANASDIDLSAPMDKGGWKLIWSEEFDYTGFPDSTKWSYDTEGNSYTSARLITKGKGDWLYGRFEIRAKLPTGRGTWPAIWMLPTDWEYGDWPKSGEIDIMENVGYDPDTIVGSSHTEKYNHAIGTQKNAKIACPDCYKAFHVYALEWEEDEYRLYVDDQLYFTFKNEGTGYEVWPYDKRFHILLNLAIGGNWGGQKGIDDSLFPHVFEIDYVRVYKK